MSSRITVTYDDHNDDEDNDDGGHEDNDAAVEDDSAAARGEWCKSLMTWTMLVCDARM